MKKLGSLVTRVKDKNGLSVPQRRRRSKSSAVLHEPQIPIWSDDVTSSECLLQKEMNPSDAFVADDFLSPHDSYEEKEVARVTETRSRRRQRGPRIAGLWGRALREESISELEENEEDDTDEFLTTPLHEAARLGSAKLVRLFLSHGGQPNEKNGKQRTALHMAAGGLTVEEEELLLAVMYYDSVASNDTTVDSIAHIGIRSAAKDATESDEEEQNSDHPVAGAKKAASAMRRFFKQTLGNQTAGQDEPVVEEKPVPPPLDRMRLSKLSADRMDTVLIIMAWSHPDDGSPSAGEGPSINSVDSRGRTALHYAAELGRSDVCMAIVSSFGAILTIIDESSRTPCELAGEQSHRDLAAQLEARALLYSDPYGVDDELMASVLADVVNGSDSRKLVPPFSWFHTLSAQRVRKERNHRVQEVMTKMREELAMRQEQIEATEIMFSYDVNDSMDSVVLPDANIVEPDESNERVVSPDSSAMEVDQSNEDTGESRRLEPAPEARSAFFRDASMSKYTQMLQAIQHSHVERFLVFHDWVVARAMEEFREDPNKAMSDAGVAITAESSCRRTNGGAQTCLICFEEFALDDSVWRNLKCCEHSFCADCLGEYIADSARTKTSGISLLCPHHDCAAPLSEQDILNLAPSPEVYESLLAAADENFVACALDLKFCPHPGCGGVVQRASPEMISAEGLLDHDLIDIVGAVCVALPEGESNAKAPLTYEGVPDARYVMSRGATQPQMAHRFCFSCGDKTIHWPISCETLEKWKEKIHKEIGSIEEGEEGDEDGNYEAVAQRLWMKANTRPCPQVCFLHRS